MRYPPTKTCDSAGVMKDASLGLSPDPSSASLTGVERPHAASEARFQALGEISAGIAHELRNSLQVASTHGFLLRRNPGAVASHLPKIEAHLQRAQRIVSDVLLLAGPKPLLVSVDLASIVARAEAAFDESVGVRFASELGGASCASHSGLLERLLCILYDNAVRAGATHIRTIARLPAVAAQTLPSTLPACAAGGLELFVVDNGPGVPVEVRSDLFRADVSSRGGLGLGLLLATRMASALSLTLSYCGNGSDADVATKLWGSADSESARSAPSGAVFSIRTGTT
jgi:signal transduction histidine kinase